MAEKVGGIEFDIGGNSTNLDKKLQGIPSQVNQTQKQINSSINKSTSAFKKASSSISNMAKTAGKAIIAGFAVKSIVNFSKECLAAYNTQIEAETKLATVMKQRMNANSQMFNSVKKLTSAQQQAGIIGDEVQMAGAQQLSTFLNSTKALETLIPAMNNLAAQQKGVKATSGDLVNIGNLMGKVMQGQTSALTRVGITFSDAEEQVLKFGTEEERAAMLSQVITNNVGKMNEALANTRAGKIAQLSNNFGDLKEVVGTFVSNIIMPFISILNTMVLKIQEAFTWLNGLFGFKMEDPFEGITGAGVEQVATGADDADTALTGASKSAKALKKSLMGFDQLNILDNSTDGGDSGSSGGAISTPVQKTGIDNGNLKETEGVISKISSKLTDLKNSFKTGFEIGLGGNNLDDIKKQASGIKKSLTEIFTDSEVQNSAGNLVKQWVKTIGSATGSITSVVISTTDCITGAWDRFLKGNKDRIKKDFVKLFDISAEYGKLRENTWKAVSEIFKVFKSDAAKNIGADIINGLYTTGETILELGGKLATDLYEFFTKPITDNAELIRETLENVLTIIEPLFETVSTTLQDLGNNAQSVYDNHIGPMIDSITNGISNLVKTFLEVWNEQIKPIFEEMVQKAQETIEQHIKPLAERAQELFGKLCDLIKALWENVLQPFLKWFIENIYPKLCVVIEGIWNTASTVINGISDSLGGIMKTLGGVIDFLTGVFSGDWEKAWGGIRDIFSGVWESLSGIIKIPLNFIIDAVNKLIRALNKVHLDIPDWLGGGVFGFNVPEIPKLANGGYVKANSPQLAVVGDNRHEGEIISPESKIEKAVALQVAPVLSSIQRLLQVIENGKGNGNGGDIVVPIYLDGDTLDIYTVKAESRRAIRSGGRA